MKRRTSVLVGLMAVAPVLARAQSGNVVQLSFVEVPSYDSVYSAPAGGQFTATVQAYAYPYGLGAYKLRVYFDPSRVSVVGATNLCVDSATNTFATTAGANYVEVSASSCNSYPYSISVAALRFRLAPGATDGSMLYLRPDTVADHPAYGGADRKADRLGALAEVCHASGIWGDVDGDGAVNSRDALITLTSAVGLPTGGYTMAFGDVDADGQVTSRDALYMLSYAILLPVDASRVAKGIVDVCAPQAVLPRAAYFDRIGGPIGQAGVSGLAIRATSGAVTVPGDSADAQLSYAWRPRVSPDGSKVLFICWDATGYPQVCSANAADGSGLVRLTRGSNINQSPDWSPDGTRIAWVKDNTLWVMNADTTGKRQVTVTGAVMGVAWRPVLGSAVVAYTNNLNNGQLRTFDVDLGGPDLLIINSNFPALGIRNTPAMPDWRPVGDSLVFNYIVDNYPIVAVTPNAAGSTFAARVPLYYAADPFWTADLGTFFKVYEGSRLRLFVLNPDGSVSRVGARDATDNGAPGMLKQ